MVQIRCARCRDEGYVNAYAWTAAENDSSKPSRHATSRRVSFNGGCFMSVIQRIHWKWVVAAGFLSEVVVMAVFFLLLLAATLAGVPEIARPMSPLDNVDAVVSSFVMVFLFALWVGKRIDADFVLHGALVGVVGALLFTVMWISTTGALAQPFWYVVAHVLKVLGGICGGMLARKRKQRVPARQQV